MTPKVRCLHCGRLIERCTQIHDPYFACRGWVHKADPLFGHGCSTGRLAWMATPA